MKESGSIRSASLIGLGNLLTPLTEPVPHRCFSYVNARTFSTTREIFSLRHICVAMPWQRF